MTESKEVDGFPGYWIYDDGQVFSDKSGKFLRPMVDTKGYKRVELYNGKRKHFNVHRLVAVHFVDGMRDGDQVCHIDSNKLNNHASNLRWGTAKDNAHDKVKNGTSPAHMVREGRHARQVLTTQDVDLIVDALLYSGESIAKIGKRFGVKMVTISAINIGSSWSHYTHGVLGMQIPIRPVADVYVNQTQAAMMLGVHYVTLRRWEKDGVGPKVFRVAGLPRYKISDILDASSWLE